MVQHVGYWYNAQIRTMILHTQRLFSNFYISNGKDDKGEDILQRVPCVFMSTDKSAVSMINNNTDTVIESSPKMVLTISEIKLNNDKISGSPYYEYVSDVTEKKFNDEVGNYEYEPGNSYSVYRLNPLPIGITFKLYILTTMQTHKFQLFEQIRMLFSPTAELQTSENPLDWTRVGALVLTGCNYSSKGTSNLDSSQLDAMDLTFELDTNLDAPALIHHNNQIETIITEIGQGKIVEDTFGWDEGDTMRIYHTPSENYITVQNNNEVILQPTDFAKNWLQLFKKYGINYNRQRNNVYLHVLIDVDGSKKKSVYGNLIVDNYDSTKAIWEYNEELLPTENLQPVNAIINPHDEVPQNIEGERYLIMEDSIPNNTRAWGELRNIKNETLNKIEPNSIIEYKNGYWTLVLDPIENPAVYYVRDLSDAKFLYTYNAEYDIWHDVLNRKYRQGNWRISSL